jgi:crotonobetainyl-CoA:carnitine CoA-transferase CaiB-like acyl-CoA transferase
MSQTPGEIKWTGRQKGEDTNEILTETLGFSEDKILELNAAGIIAQSTAKGK